MGCGCGKSSRNGEVPKFPPKKSSRMPMKKPASTTQDVRAIQENEMTHNDRRAKIIKVRNARKLKQIRRQQFEWERKANRKKQ